MFKVIGDVLRGIVLNPVLTAFARGTAEAAVFLILYSVMDAVASGQLADQVGQAGPFILIVGRTLEGVVDKIDTAKQRQRDAIRSDPDAPGYDLDEPTAADYGEPT